MAESRILSKNTAPRISVENTKKAPSSRGYGEENASVKNESALHCWSIRKDNQEFGSDADDVFFPIVIGNKITVNVPESIVIGNDCIINAPFCQIFGDRSLLLEDALSCSVRGDDAVVKSHFNSVKGDGAQIYGNFNLNVGSSSTLHGEGNCAVGDRNIPITKRNTIYSLDHSKRSDEQLFEVKTLTDLIIDWAYSAEITKSSHSKILSFLERCFLDPIVFFRSPIVGGSFNPYTVSRVLSSKLLTKNAHLSQKWRGLMPNVLKDDLVTPRLSAALKNFSQGEPNGKRNCVSIILPPELFTIEVEAYKPRSVSLYFPDLERSNEKDERSVKREEKRMTADIDSRYRCDVLVEMRNGLMMQCSRDGQILNAAMLHSNTSAVAANDLTNDLDTLNMACSCMDATIGMLKEENRKLKQLALGVDGDNCPDGEDDNIQLLRSFMNRVRELRDRVAFLERKIEESDRSKAESRLKVRNEQLEKELAAMRKENVELESQRKLFEEYARVAESATHQLNKKMEIMRTDHKKDAKRTKRLEKRLNKLAGDVRRKCKELDEESLPKTSRSCIICFDLDVSHIYLPCMHYGICEECATVEAFTKKCPICNAENPTCLRVHETFVAIEQ